MSRPDRGRDPQRPPSRREILEARRKLQNLRFYSVTGVSLLFLALVIVIVSLPDAPPEPEEVPGVVLEKKEAPPPRKVAEPEPAKKDEPDPKNGKAKTTEPEDDAPTRALARFTEAHAGRIKRGELADALRELKLMRGVYHDHPEVGPALMLMETELRVSAEQARLDAEKRIGLAIEEGRLDHAQQEIETTRRRMRDLYDQPLFRALEKRVAQKKAVASRGALLAKARELEKAGKIDEALAAYHMFVKTQPGGPQLDQAIDAIARLSALKRYAGHDPAELSRVGEKLSELERRVGRHIAAAKPSLEDLDWIAGVGPSPELLERVINGSRSYSKRDGGVIVRKEMTFEKYSAPIFVGVPRRYDPRRSYPMIVYLHGTTASVLRCEQQAQTLMGQSRGEYFALVPKSQSPKTGAGWGPSQYGINPVLQSIRYVLKEYNVDPNRISLTGQSMGGHATWNIGMMHPGWFASLAPKSGCANQKWQRGLYSNLINLPVYAIHGARDRVVPVKMARDTIKVVKSLGIDVTYKEYAASGHEGAPWAEVFKSYKWMSEQVRDPLPRRVIFYTRFPRVTRAYWVRIDEYAERKRFHYKFVAARTRALVERAEAFSEPPGVQVQVKDGSNEIVIESVGIKRLTLFLHPDLVAFGKPVRIVRKGETIKRVTLEPDLPTMLRLARKSRGVVYWAEVPVSIE